MILFDRRALSMLLASAAVAACQPQQTRPSDAVATDSARGTISVTGTSFEKQIIMTKPPEVVRLHAASGDSAAMSRIAGAEIVIHGTRSANAFSVTSFTVVAVEGKPVVDGVLQDDRGTLRLKTIDALIELGNPPMRLRSMLGARVWIGGPLSTGPNVYGVIVPAASPAGTQ